MSAVLFDNMRQPLPRLRRGLASAARFVFFNRLHIVAMGPGIVLFWNQFMHLPLDWKTYAVITGVVAFGYLMNIFFDHREDGLNGEAISERVAGRNRATLALAVATMIGTLALAVVARGPAYALLVAATLTGAGLYSAPLRRRGCLWRVKAQPWLKNGYAAFHWSVLLLLLAWAYAGHFTWTPLDGLIALICFGMNYFVELLWDVRDIDGDRQAGVRTLASVLGARDAGRCLQGVNLSICASVLAGLVTGLLPPCFWVIVLHGLAVALFIRHYVGLPSRQLASHLYVVYVMLALVCMSILDRFLPFVGS